MDFLKHIRYPGRFIVLGKDGESFVAIYGATGRSDSSLNRKYIQQDNEVVAVQLATGGNEELLTYPALRFLEKGMVVANGRQGKAVKPFSKETAQEQLARDLIGEQPEPDEYKTPRITGCYFETSFGATTGLHIVRQLGENLERQAWVVPLLSGTGKYISTYAGEDVRPTPSFANEPKDVSLQFGSAESAAVAVFNLLMPPDGEKDYRVGVVACYKKLNQQPVVSIKNRLD